MLQELTSLGLTPVNALLVGAIVWLWKYHQKREAKQESTREEWHTETRQRVEDMQGHIDECDKDRTDLRTKVTSLEATVDRMTRCPRTDCPMRLT